MGESVIDIVLRGQALLVAALTLIGGVALWMLRAHILQVVDQRTAGKASADAVAALDERLDAHEGRLTSIEAALRHLPTAEQMTALTIAVSDVRGEMRAIRASVDGLEKLMSATGRRVELIDEHLKRGA